MRSDQDAHAHRLERLSHMHGYDVAPNEPDPRGWKVVNRERRRVGEVKDLIVDRERMERKSSWNGGEFRKKKHSATMST